MHTGSRRPARGHCEAFALVTALTLMAFVLLWLLFMTLLIRVETQGHSIALAQVRAREAARLALMLALGELQKYAGPDQRVTARAEILGTDRDGNPNFVQTARFWTGVWDTSEESLAPQWLVSGSAPDPGTNPPFSVPLERRYDSDDDGELNELNDYAATEVERVRIDDATRCAWWVIDEGVKAPLRVVRSMEHEVASRQETEAYLDYNLATKRIGTALFDPNFDFPEFFDINDPASEIDEKLNTAISPKQAELLLQENPERDAIVAALVHAHTLHNQFVLSNTLEGGLKKDLSFLKTVDAASTTQDILDTLYSDPNGIITPDVVHLLQFRGNPTAYPPDEVMGMQLPETSIASIEAKTNDFTLAPVVTEFQLSIGIAADSLGLHKDASNSAITTDSPVYLVYKIYLELWNPYTIPMRIGDPNLATALGYSEIKVEIENLPNFQITNQTQPGNTFAGSIPKISQLWSDSLSAKTLRPGMVVLRTLPLDSSGDENSGTFHQRIGSTTIRGAATDDYTGTFSFGSAPVKIKIYGADSASNAREILDLSLDGYEDFEIDYDGGSATTRLKRQRLKVSEYSATSETARAMSKASLEVPGYAFGIRFKALCEQSTDPSLRDISNWLSRYDPRNRSIDVDLSDWSIHDPAWGDDPLPYDFRVNAVDTDLGDFVHAEGFKTDDLFQFVPSGSPREDRIARFIDLPSHEIADVGIFRSLKFRDYNANSVGNPWGGELNKLYDQYFFSTLPDPRVATWDGQTPLYNGRIQPTSSSGVSLDTPDTARSLVLENGFNLNSTSISAWSRLLAGKDFPANTLELRDERAENNGEPSWNRLHAGLNNTYINNPHTVVHNANDGASSASYQFIARERTENYPDRFSLVDDSWKAIRQHPAFIQNVRELTDTEIDLLSAAVVSALKDFYSENGHPPFSMSEFINSSILQDAIDSVPAINLRNEEVDFIPPHAPSFVSQATILNQIGQFSFVRSDTFRIRAYGEVVATKGHSARAYCEALVQRSPVQHNDPAMGRSFKVVDFRWITPDF